MPTAPVDDHGTVLYFKDSGAPDASTDYATIVFIHGACVHGGKSHERMSDSSSDSIVYQIYFSLSSPSPPRGTSASFYSTSTGTLDPRRTLILSSTSLSQHGRRAKTQCTGR